MGLIFSRFLIKFDQNGAKISPFCGKNGAEMLHFVPQNVGHKLHFEEPLGAFRGSLNGAVFETLCLKMWGIASILGGSLWSFGHFFSRGNCDLKITPL